MNNGPQYPGDQPHYGHRFPDIGPDPLKTNLESTAPVRRHIHDSIERLKDSMVRQQQGVPDQTALVWRIDIDRVLTELCVATMQRDDYRKEVEKLKEPLICAITVARDMEQQQK